MAIPTQTADLKSVLANSSADDECASLPASGNRPNRLRVDQAVHDLRNSLNAMVMNAAVLEVRISDVPEVLRPFVRQIIVSGQECRGRFADLLAAVSALDSDPPAANS